MKMMTVGQPPKWYRAYDTTEERRFFVGQNGKSGLVRGKSGDGKSLKYRSVEALAKESGLTQAQVEKIIQKYIPVGVVVASPKSPDLWGYWENVDEVEAVKSMSDADQNARITKAGGNTIKSTKKANPNNAAQAAGSMVGSSSSPAVAPAPPNPSNTP